MKIILKEFESLHLVSTVLTASLYSGERRHWMLCARKSLLPVTSLRILLTGLSYHSPLIDKTGYEFEKSPTLNGKFEFGKARTNAEVI